MPFSTVSRDALRSVLADRGFAVSPIDCYGEFRVNRPGAPVGIGSVRSGAVEVSVHGSSVDNRFGLLSTRSCVSEPTVAEAAATVARWLAPAAALESLEAAVAARFVALNDEVAALSSVALAAGAPAPEVDAVLARVAAGFSYDRDI